MEEDKIEKVSAEDIIDKLNLENKGFFQKLNTFMIPMTRWQKLETYALLIYSLFSIPAFLFHEFCHIVAIGLTFSGLTVQDFYFYKFRENGKVLSFLRASFQVDHSSSYVGIFIAIAPLLGYAILFLDFFHYYLNGSHWAFWFILYMLLFFKMFNLSDADVYSFKANLKNLRNKN